MKNLLLLDIKSQLSRCTVVLLGIACSLAFNVQAQNQTLVLAGGALSTCSSSTPKNCQNSAQIKGKAHNLFKVTDAKISTIAQYWPSGNNDKKLATINALNTIKIQKKVPMTRKNLLWLWRDINNTSLSSLSVDEYNFVFDMLEIFQPNIPQLNSAERLKEQVNTDLNNQSATNNILQFVSGSLKVNNAEPTMLVVTASSRDPYEAADLAQALFAQSNINTQWLALTPALVHAITNNSCDKLPVLRNTQMKIYNREAIYPDRIKAELSLCKKGIDALVSLIKHSTGVVFNDGDAALASLVLFDQNDRPYPWTEALQSRPVIMGAGAGTVVQNKIISEFTTTSLSALRESTNNSHAGGLGSFNFGVLDTQFGEQNRTFRLAMAIDKSQAKNIKAEVQHGFGIDENTALVVIKSPEGNLMTVIGKSGVVHLANQINNQSKGKHYSYSYWPTGSVIDITNNAFTLSERTISQALPAIKIPSLPVQRFGAILTNSKLRSLTQAMCLSQEQSAVAQQDEFIISLTATKSTSYHRISAKELGCAVINLDLAVSTF
ncbi:cyanophycinase [Pseudoalteromonas aliena]|uniref:cyanophycinase n=1 Tax=Pseudoalteromonas aliena TaxID=247523 RepID=UPI0024949813|nr:cyanophycinase [Pseudoalteromonas aliena]